MADYPQDLMTRIGAALAAYTGVPSPTGWDMAAEPGSVVMSLTLSYDTQPPADQAHDSLKPLIDDPEALEAYLRSQGIEIDLTGDTDIDQVRLSPPFNTHRRARACFTFRPLTHTRSRARLFYCPRIACFHGRSHCPPAGPSSASKCTDAPDHS
jgi:hypothetical protein